jgi:hypothetical protein
MLFERCSFYHTILNVCIIVDNTGNHNREFIAAEKMENLKA